MLSSLSSVIFFHPSVGEFWYNLSLSAEAPTPTSLVTMECELGRWVQQTITLNNPTGTIAENYFFANFRPSAHFMFENNSNFIRKSTQ